jgi:hypothetical protein
VFCLRDFGKPLRTFDRSFQFSIIDRIYHQLTTKIARRAAIWHHQNMFKAHLPRRRILAALALLPLAACTETAGELAGQAGPPRKAPGITLSLASLSGAPESTISALSSALVSEAQKRDMLIVGVDGKPRYQARGYLALASGEGRQSELSYVFDVYDQSLARTKRIAGTVPLAAGTDWDAVTPAVTARVAAAALDEFAGFIVDTTTLVAGTTGPAASPRTAAALLSAR